MNRIAILLSCMILSGSVSALAQNSLDSNLVLIPSRPLTEIEIDLSATRSRLQVAQASVPVAEGAEKQARIQIDPWRKELDLINAKIDADKKESNETAKASHEAEKKVLERQKDLAENNYDLRKAETDLAKANADWLAAQIKSWEFESELMSKRLEREGVVKSGATAVGLAAVDQMIRNLEKRALEAQKDEADKSGNRADKEKNIVSKRIQILETQNKLMTGK